MGTETRAGSGGRYYYRSYRRRGSPAKEYLGAGELADMHETLAGHLRQVRDLDELQARFDLECLQHETIALREWFEACDRLVAAGMEASGFRRVRRMWRRQRGAGMSALKSVDDVKTSWVPMALIRAAGGHLDDDTRAKANAGDKAALKLVEEFLAKPAAVAFWGDAGFDLMVRWASVIEPKDFTRRRFIWQYASDLRDRLTGPDADPLVQLVAERVVVAWMFAAAVETEYTRKFGTLRPAEEKIHLQRIGTGQRSLMAAARTLAKVKRGKLADVLNLVNVTVPAGAGPRVVDPAGAAGGSIDAAN